MIDNAIEIEIWNRIENDFVLMIGLLPYAPGFIKAFLQFTRTIVLSLNHQPNSTEYKSSSTFNSDRNHVQLGDHSDGRDTSSDADLVRERESV